MPQPLSEMRMKVMPPFWISMVTRVAPASMAFSTSSLTTEAGRSTTSPAAIRSATWELSWTIFGMETSFYRFRRPKDMALISACSVMGAQMVPAFS